MWQGQAQALMCVDGEFSTFRGVSFEDVIDQWDRVGGETVEVNYNFFRLFRDGSEVGFLTRAVSWENEAGTNLA